MEAKLSQWTGNIVGSKWFRNTIIVLIIIASVIVGLETSESLTVRYGKLFFILDKIIIYSFALEAILKMLQYGRKFYLYFTDY